MTNNASYPLTSSHPLACCRLIVSLVLCVVAAQQLEAQDLTHVEGLGSIAFPNTGSEAAQPDFVRGVLLLHSFEFEPARESFRRSREADPNFALAYWGEAMAHNYPLWRTVNVDAARGVLDALAPDPESRRAKAGTEREAMYMDAVEKLYGNGDKNARDTAYMEAMKRLHQAYPEDDEARAFYALSILGSKNGTRDFATYMRAAATVQPVFLRNSKHPGAAHYLIHSFDDPIHAPLGLPAANAYSDIAPSAAHAQHMTTHIFVALGMWDRVVENNIRAMEVQDADLLARGRQPNACGHYSSWRHYGHLQLGEVDEAETLMNACFERASQPDASPGELGYFASMRGLHVLDAQSATDATPGEMWDLPADHALAAWTGESSDEAVLAYQFLNGYVASRTGRVKEASRIAAMFSQDDAKASIYRQELEGLVALAQGRTDAGIDLLRAAAEAEAALPFEFGPPAIIKPTYELLGQELLRLGRTDKARDALEAAAARTPGRRSVVVALTSL